jgi:hypothetical protein
MLEAARKALPALTQDETTLIQRFAAGEPAFFQKARPGQPDPEARAAVLRWLLANASLGEGSRVRGLHVTNLCVRDEDLDLNGLSIGFPLILEHCRFRRLFFRDTRLITLRLTGSECDGLKGDRMRVEHGMLLNGGFRSYGTVWLPAISVGDDLLCDDCRFAGGRDRRYALLLDGARVGGRIFFRRMVAAPAFKDGTDEPTERSDSPAGAGEVSMQGCRIGGNLVCIGASFLGSSRVSLHLGSSVVSGDAAFEHAKAAGELVLRQAGVNGTLTFRGADISGRIDLSRASIGGDLDFGRPPSPAPGRAKDTPAKLGSELQLAGATVKGRLDMGTADLSRLTGANLCRTSVGYFDDCDVTWPKENVLLEGISLGGIAVGSIEKRLDWLEAQGGERWSPQPYEQVAAALRLAGEDSFAREVAIERERDRRKHGGLAPITRIWSRLIGSTIAYGYRPYWAFGWAILVVLAGWLVFGGALGHVAFSHGDQAPHFYPLVYSLDAFLPIVDLGQASEWSPEGLWPNIALWLEICLGWLLTTLGVVGVTGLIRDD